MSSVSPRTSARWSSTLPRSRAGFGRTGLLAIAITAASCSPAVLTGLGGASSDWIEGTIDGAPVGDPGAELVPTAQVGWWNDDLGGETVEARAVVLAAVAGRRAGLERSLHASRWEVAAVLPGVLFPSLVPAAVESLTSLLVLDATRPELARDRVAEFEMWTTEPYTRSRQSGEVATLTVSPAAAQVAVACPPQQVPACVETEVGGISTTRRHSDQGDTWSWQTGGYDYQLFVRSDYILRAAEMIASLVPLAEIGGPATTAGLSAAPG